MSSGDPVDVDFTRIAAACDAVLPAANVAGASVTIMDSAGAHELIYATDSVARHLDELQFVTGEGPQFDSFRLCVPVQHADLSDVSASTRWPGFGPEAAATGARAIASLPLTGGGLPFGCLGLYRREPEMLTVAELVRARSKADIAARALVDELCRQVVSEAAIARSSGFGKPEVNQAAGMIAVQLGISVDEALSRLRAYAFANQVSVTGVASDVIARRFRFERGDD